MGDKASQIAAGEAMHRVKLLTMKQKKATLRDSQLKRRAAKELAGKVDAVRKSRELAKKRQMLQQEREYSQVHQSMQKKKEEKERLEREVRQADANLRTETHREIGPD